MIPLGMDVVETAGEFFLHFSWGCDDKPRDFGWKTWGADYFQRDPKEQNRD